MIILHVTYTAKPGQKENYLKAVAAAGIDAASRAEAGNVRYDYFYAAQQEDTILLWKPIKQLPIFNSWPLLRINI